MTYDELRALVQRFDGETLETVSGRKFRVGVSSAENCPFFTPLSSGWGQTDGRNAAERFIERYNKLGSLRPKDYADITRNASYYIGLLLAAGRA